jgi:cytochrome c biogenesis protein
VVLGLGESASLPDGLGSIEFTELRRFVTFDVHRDPTQLPVALSAGLIMAGLIVTMFVTRRRAWIRVKSGKARQVTVEFALLARGEDPGLQKGLEDLVQAFSKEQKPTLKG